MTTQSNWAIAAILMLVTAVAVGSSVSVALAQNASKGTVESKVKDALKAASQGRTSASIGGKFIIVGACPPGATLDPTQCTFYNTTPIPSGGG